MNVLLLAPAALSALLLAAHFLRAGHLVVVLLALGMIPLLAVRRPWIVRLVQAVLVLGAVEWLSTLATLVQLRTAVGVPYARMAAILGGVALFTAVSALLFETRRLRRRYMA